MRQLDADGHVGDYRGRSLANVAKKDENNNTKERMTHYNPFHGDYGYYYYSINLGTQLKGFLLSHDYFSSCISTSTSVCSPPPSRFIPSSSSAPFSPTFSSSKCEAASLFRFSTVHNDEKHLNNHLLRCLSLCSTKELLARYVQAQAPDSHLLPRSFLPCSASAESSMTTAIANEMLSCVPSSEDQKASGVEKEIRTYPTRVGTATKATCASDRPTNEEDAFPLPCASSAFSLEPHWTLADGLRHTADWYRFLHDQLSPFCVPETSPSPSSCSIGASLSLEVPTLPALPASSSPRMTLWRHLISEMLDHVGTAMPFLSLLPSTSSSLSSDASPLLFLCLQLTQRASLPKSSRASAEERVAPLAHGGRPQKTGMERQGKGGEPPPPSSDARGHPTVGRKETRKTEKQTGLHWLHSTVASIRRKGWPDGGWRHVKEVEEVVDVLRDARCHRRTGPKKEGTPTPSETQDDDHEEWKGEPPAGLHDFYPFFRSSTPSVLKDGVQNNYFLCTLVQTHLTQRGEAKRRKPQEAKKGASTAIRRTKQASTEDLAGVGGGGGEAKRWGDEREATECLAYASSPPSIPTTTTTGRSSRTTLHGTAANSPSWITSLFWCAQQWTFFVSKVLRWWMGLSAQYAVECKVVRHNDTAASDEVDRVPRDRKGEDDGWPSWGRNERGDEEMPCIPSMAWSFSSVSSPLWWRWWRLLPYILRVSVSRWTEVFLGGGSHLLGLLLRILEDDLSEEMDGDARRSSPLNAASLSSLDVRIRSAFEEEKKEEPRVAHRVPRTASTGRLPPTTAPSDGTRSMGKEGHPPVVRVPPSWRTETSYRLVVLQGMLREILSTYACLCSCAASPTRLAASPLFSPLPPLRLSSVCTPALRRRTPSGGRVGRAVRDGEADEMAFRVGRRRYPSWPEKEEVEERRSESCSDGLPESAFWKREGRAPHAKTYPQRRRAASVSEGAVRRRKKRRGQRDTAILCPARTSWEGRPGDGRHWTCVKETEGASALYHQRMPIERRCWTRFHERVCACSSSSFSRETPSGVSHPSSFPPSFWSPFSSAPPLREKSSASPPTVATTPYASSPFFFSSSSCVGGTSRENDLTPSLFRAVRFPPIRVVGKRSEGGPIRSEEEEQKSSSASSAEEWDALEKRVPHETRNDTTKDQPTGRRGWGMEEASWEGTPVITIELHPLLRQWMDHHKNPPVEAETATMALPCAFAAASRPCTGREGKEEEGKGGEDRLTRRTPPPIPHRTAMTEEGARMGRNERGTGRSEKNISAPLRTPSMMEVCVASFRRDGYHCTECQCTSPLWERLCSLLLFPLHPFWLLSPPITVSPTDESARHAMQSNGEEKERRSPLPYSRSVCHEVAILAYYYLSSSCLYSPVSSIHSSIDP